MYLNIQLTNALRSIGADWVPLSQTDLWHGHIQAEDAQDLVEDLAHELKPLHEQNRFYGVWTLDTIFEDSNGHFHILPNFSLDIVKSPSLQQLISPFSAYELVTDNFLWPLGPHTDVYGLGQVIRTLLMKVLPSPAINRTMQDQEPLSNYQVQYFTQSQLQAIDKAGALEIPARFANLDEFSLAIGTSGQNYSNQVEGVDLGLTDETKTDSESNKEDEAAFTLPAEFDFEDDSSKEADLDEFKAVEAKEDLDLDSDKSLIDSDKSSSSSKNDSVKGFIGGLFKGKSDKHKELRAEDEQNRLKEEQERKEREEREAREAREAEEKSKREAEEQERKEREEREAREAREAEEKRKREEEEERKAREARLAKEAEERRLREDEERKARELREAEERRKREEEERKAREARLAQEAEERRLREDEERKARELREAEEKRKREDEERKAREARLAKEAEERRLREAEERKARELREAEEKRKRDEERKVASSAAGAALGAAAGSSLAAGSKDDNLDSFLSGFDNQNARPLEPIKSVPTPKETTAPTKPEKEDTPASSKVGATTIGATESKEKAKDKKESKSKAAAVAAASAKDSKANPPAPEEPFDSLAFQSANSKKKKGSILPLIIIAALILLGVGGYILFGMGDKETKSPEEKPTISQVQKEEPKPVVTESKQDDQPTSGSESTSTTEATEASGNQGNTSTEETPEDALSALFADTEPSKTTSNETGATPTSDTTDATQSGSESTEGATDTTNTTSTPTAPETTAPASDTTEPTTNADSGTQASTADTNVANQTTEPATQPSETTTPTGSQQDVTGDMSNLVANPDRQSDSEIAAQQLAEEEKRLAEEQARLKAQEEEEKRKQAEEAQRLREQEKRVQEATRQKMAKRGTLLFSITPWGNVSVNGKKYGASPPFKSLNVSPGKYKITITNGDLPPAVFNVDVQEGKTTTIQHGF
ncbi:hypothetical protein [Taylorella asinigenitalis]|uniref:hypothetical protein n=1 Tax=Taylorella asinigenitalis TaxID=84590 RepID=UPI00048FBD93|nr:hypothetical protein [Taylorella asinigenitalis]